jgi:adenylosuccinate synthase
VVAPYHKAEDELREELLQGSGDVPHELGTTRRGIGPAYAEKLHRSAAIRMGDLLRPDVLRFKLGLAKAFKAGQGTIGQFDAAALAKQMEEWGGRLAPMIKDTVYLLHDMLGQGKRLLFEGANATLLDVDHGTFPFVTAVELRGTRDRAGERRLGTELVARAGRDEGVFDAGLDAGPFRRN